MAFIFNSLEDGWTIRKNKDSIYLLSLIISLKKY